jgi:hypothetical protein
MSQKEIEAWIEHLKSCKDCKPTWEWLSFVNRILREIGKPELKIVYVSYIDVKFHPFSIFLNDMVHSVKVEFRKTGSFAGFLEDLLTAAIKNSFTTYHVFRYNTNGEDIRHMIITPIPTTTNDHITPIHVTINTETDDKPTVTIIYSVKKWKDYDDIKEAIEDLLCFLALQELAQKEVL